MLAGKRLLITGVIRRDSIAFEVARRAQEHGAEVLLTGFGRTKRMTERTAQRLDPVPDVLELDVNRPEDLAALAEEIKTRWGRVDGVLHAIAYAPGDALGGNFMDTPGESAVMAFKTSAYSLQALASALRPLLNGNGDGKGASIVALDFDATVAWPAYDFMGVAKAALESVARYLARDLGPEGVRVNCVSAGPIETMAAGGIPGFEGLAEAWNRQAPLGWDTSDAGPVADTTCFLLSSLSSGITGEIVHVDGGYHAMGAPLR
jgi:enoyl ACP reductase